MMLREKEKMLESEINARKELSSNKIHTHEKVAALEKTVSLRDMLLLQINFIRNNPLLEYHRYN